MAKTNAERQAEWRQRRKQELDSLRNGLRDDGRSVNQLSQDEYEFLTLQLQRYRADKQAAGDAPGRFNAIQSVMRMKVEVDKSKDAERLPAVRKTKPVTSFNRDLFDV